MACRSSLKSPLRGDSISTAMPAATVRGTLENVGYWDFLNQTLHEQGTLAIQALK